MKKTKNLKAKLTKRELTVGSWLQVGHPVVTEIMAQAGFEWLAVDLEHSAISLPEMQILFQTMQAYEPIPLARVSANDAVQIKRVMDAGAAGVVVPNVNSAEDARKITQSVKYPPLGRRGVGLARAQGYGLEFERYKDWMNDNSIVVVQIEHIEGINNLEQILKVDGIDASIIGPYDLSASMGHPGEFEHQDVKKAIKEYAGVCRKLGKSAGFHIILPDADRIKDKVKEGFNFLAFSMDTLLLADKCKFELSKIKKDLK